MTKREPATLGGKPFGSYVHACAFLRSREDEYRLMAPFVAQGLERGEKVVYLVHPELREQHARCLEAAGLDATVGDGSLDIVAWEGKFRDGAYDVDGMLATLESALFATSTPMRIVGQADWLHANAPAVDQLLEYEVRANDMLQRAQHAVVCCYQLHRMDAATMMDLLRAHPLTVIGDAVYENPFYTAPSRMLAELRARRQQ